MIRSNNANIASNKSIANLDRLDHLKCYCGELIQEKSKLTLNCRKCGKTLHYDCYFGNDNFIYKEGQKNEFLCVLCKFEEINQFDMIDRVFLHPIFLPKKKFSESMTIFIDNLLRTKIRLDGSQTVEFICIEAESVFKFFHQIKWPNTNFQLFINGVKMKLVDSIPLDISPWIESTNIVEMTSDEIKERFIVTMVACKKRDISCISPPKSKYSIYEFKKRQINILNEGSMVKMKVSLKCLYSGKIIKIPVRGSDCDHFQCFDFYSYVQINYIKRRFSCPICKKPLFINELVIDLYFNSILVDLGKKFENTLEDYEVFVTNEGKYIPKKIPLCNEKLSSENSNDNRKDNIRSYAGMIEKMNDSDFEGEDDVQNVKEETEIVVIDRRAIERDAGLKLKHLAQEVLSEDPKDYFKVLTDKLKLCDFLKDVNPAYMSGLLSQINVLQKSKNLIFPYNVISMSTTNYTKLCENISKNYEIFYQFIFLWSNSKFKIAEVISGITTVVNPNNPLQETQRNHYFALELLLGSAFVFFKPFKNYLEFEIGNFLGYYSRLTKLKESQIAHILDIISCLFPNFYLPNKQFIDDNDHIEYFTKLIRFYEGFFSVFSRDINLISHVFRLLFEPIKVPHLNMSQKELYFLSEIWEEFISPFLDRLKLTKDDKLRFIVNYDTIGYFRNYLTDKLRWDFSNFTKLGKLLLNKSN